MLSVVGPKCCSVMALARATVTGYIGRQAYDGYMLLLGGTLVASTAPLLVPEVVTAFNLAGYVRQQHKAGSGGTTW